MAVAIAIQTRQTIANFTPLLFKFIPKATPQTIDKK